MSLHPMLHWTQSDGQPSTIWQSKVETLEAAEKPVRDAIRQARRAKGRDLRIDIYDDLLCVSVWRARVKAIGGKL